MRLAVQKLNAQMIALLGSKFQRLKDPPRLFEVSYNLGGVAPTDANLDSEIATPANVPGNCMFLVRDTSDATNMYLVVADTTNTQWLYVAFTVAV